MHPEIITGVVKREKDDDDLSDTTDIENEIISNDISFHGDLDSGNESLSPPVVRQLVPGQMPTSCLPADTDYEPVLELEPVEEMVDESGCRIKAWRCDECDLRFQYFASFQKHNDREHPGQPLIPQSRRWDVDDEESDASDYVMDTAYLVDSDDSDYAPSKQKQKKKTTTRRKSTGRRTGRPPKNDPPLPKVWVRGPYKKRDRMTSQYASWSEPIARKRRGRPPRSENQVEVPKEEPTQCSACPLIFDTRALANSHYRRNHFLPYHCLLCNKRFDAFKKYYIHSEMVHDTVVDDVLEASLSDAGDSDPEDCRVNVEGRTEPVLHPCDMCPNLYPTEIVLSGHKLRRHADEIPDMAVIESLKRKWRSRFQPENIEAHETALKQLGPISDERKKAGLPDQKSKRGQNRPRNSGLSEEEKLRRAEAKLLRRKIRKATGVRLKATTFGLRGQDGKFVPGYRKSDEEKELTHRLAAIRKAERRRLLYQAQKEAREKGLPVPRNLKEAGIEYEPYTTHPHFRKAIEADPVNIQKLLLAATISDRLPDDLAPKSTPELDDATHEIAELDESTGVSRPKRQSAIDAIGTIKEFTKKLGTVRVDKGEELDPERDQNANQAEKEIEDRMKRNEEYDDDFHMTDDEEPEEEDDDSDYEEEKEKEKDSIAAYRRLGRQRLEEIAAAALKQVQEQVAAASEGTSAVENGENGTPAEEGEGSKKLTLVEKALRSLGIMKESKRGPRPGMKRGPYKKTREGKDESAICPFTGKILSSGRRRRRKDMSRDDINAERREKYPRKNESTYYKPRKDTCRKCNMEFEDDTELCRHAKSVHFDPASGDRFVFSRDDPNGYQAMLRRGKKAFACQREGCETQKFAYFEFLSKHMLDVHQEKLMDEDGEEVPTTPSDKYLETNPWTKCAECDHVVRQASMRRHKQYLHTPEGLPCPFPCDFPDCGRTFRGRLKLMWHRRSVHHELRDIPCKYCDKTFGTPYQARKHVRVHEGFRYQCSSCELSFKSNQGKINHELTVHSGKSPEFYCDEPGCNKVFWYSREIPKHKTKAHGHPPRDDWHARNGKYKRPNSIPIAVIGNPDGTIVDNGQNLTLAIDAPVPPPKRVRRTTDGVPAPRSPRAPQARKTPAKPRKSRAKKASQDPAETNRAIESLDLEGLHDSTIDSTVGSTVESEIEIQPDLYRAVHDQLTNETVYVLQDMYNSSNAQVYHQPLHNQNHPQTHTMMTRSQQQQFQQQQQQQQLHLQQQHQQIQHHGHHQVHQVQHAPQMMYQQTHTSSYLHPAPVMIAIAGECKLCTVRTNDLRSHYSEFHKIPAEKVQFFLTM